MQLTDTFPWDFWGVTWHFGGPHLDFLFPIPTLTWRAKEPEETLHSYFSRSCCNECSLTFAMAITLSIYYSFCIYWVFPTSLRCCIRNLTVSSHWGANRCILIVLDVIYICWVHIMSQSNFHAKNTSETVRKFAFFWKSKNVWCK